MPQEQAQDVPPASSDGAPAPATATDDEVQQLQSQPEPQDVPPASSDGALQQLQSQPEPQPQPPTQRSGPNVIVLSSAGKPIFSRWGDEEKLTAACGLIQAIRASILDDPSLGGDIQSLQAGGTRMVFHTVGHLTLLAIAEGGTGSGECETEAYLRMQLEYVYGQIIFTLTDTIQNVFTQRHNYDLRSMLGATETVMRGVLDQASPLGNGGAFLCAGVESVWPISHEIRDHASQVLSSVCGKHSDTCLFAILLAKNEMISVVMPRYKPHQLHPSDLHLILNFCNHQPGLLTNELWFPICLPRFNSSGFVYAYTTCLDSGTGLACCLISQENSTEQFERFRKAGASIRQKLGLRAPKSSVLFIKDASRSNGDVLVGDGSNRGGDTAESEMEKTNFDDIAWQRNEGGGNDDISGEDEEIVDDEKGSEKVLDELAGVLGKDLTVSETSNASVTQSSNGDRDVRPFDEGYGGKSSGHQGESSLVKILNEVKRNRVRDTMIDEYLQLASAMHFLFRIDVAVYDTGGMLTQCLSPPLQFPFVDEKSKRRVYCMYQRLALRLRLGSASVESTMDAFAMIADDHDDSENTHASMGIGKDCQAQCLLESPPNVHGCTYVLDGSELFIAINGRDFELYATLPGKIPPRSGTAYCARLVRRLMNDEGRLFLAYPHTWHR